MKKCPFCRANILDDSVFCDQCGKELRMCLDCHSYVAGRFCTNCSSKNIIMAKDFDFDKNCPIARPATNGKEYPIQSHKQAMQQSEKSSSTSPLSYPIYQKEKTEPPFDEETEVPESKFINHMIGITHKVTFHLDSSKGRYLFGRKVGEFTDFFNSIRFISRKHAEMDYDRRHRCWVIMDLGSSNGTFINGQRLTPQVPKPVKKGDEIQVAFERFKFE